MNFVVPIFQPLTLHVNENLCSLFIILVKCTSPKENEKPVAPHEVSKEFQEELSRQDSHEIVQHQDLKEPILCQ